MSFLLARSKHQGVPLVKEKPTAAGANWLKGALLLVNASDQYAECGADPASVAAVALSGAGTASGALNPIGSREFPPGYCQAVAVQDETPFTAEYVGTLPAVAGGSYGVVKGADGKWRVDFSDTTATRVKLVSIEETKPPLNRNRVEVVFLAANVQTIGG